VRKKAPELHRLRSAAGPSAFNERSSEVDPLEFPHVAELFVDMAHRRVGKVSAPRLRSRHCSKVPLECCT
jgi:hypothetical protein